jgi:hypothetical protein
VIELTPAHTAYWQEGVGKGGEKPWKFSCMCGEVCSSYENFRYHPTGRMYECSNPACCLWSHVACVLGQISDDELAKRKVRSSCDVSGCGALTAFALLDCIRAAVTTLCNVDCALSCGCRFLLHHVGVDVLQDLLCGACKAKSRRLSKYLGVDITTLYTPAKEETAPGAGGSKDAKRGKSAKTTSSTERAGEEDDGKPWKFKCKCGEVCSSYEKSIFHPAGQWYECSKCEIWSHVHCNLGNLTPAQVEALPVRNLKMLLTRFRLVKSISHSFPVPFFLQEVLCFSCTTAARRSRKRGAAFEDAPAAGASVESMSQPAKSSRGENTAEAAEAVTAEADAEASASCGATVSTDAAADVDMLPAVEEAAILLLATAAKPTASVLCPDEVAVAVPSIPSVVERGPAYPCTVEADLPAPASMVPEVDEISCLPAHSAGLSDHEMNVNVIE